MLTRNRRTQIRIRVVALSAAGVLGLFGLAAAGSASAQPSAQGHSGSAAPTRRSAGTSAIERSRQPQRIKHVVVLYLENHSFDSLLGFWCNDNPGRCPDGGMPSFVTLSNGAVVAPKVEPDRVPGVGHTVAAQVRAINGGRMDGWENVPRCTATQKYRCVGGYTPSQIPNLATLADDFAISDRTFSMGDSPSWGGHLYAVMGSLDGFTGDNPVPTSLVRPGPGWGCDSGKVTTWRRPGGPLQTVPSCVPDFNIGLRNGGAFEPTPASYAPTIMDRLAAAGLSWQIFGEPIPEISGTASPGYIWDICPSFAECLDTSQNANNVQSAQFIRAAESGNLPNFAVVTPGGSDAAFSEHNGFSMTAGDDWLGQVASAVMNGPEWKSTAMFITWDDCGCFYDQVKPGINPDGTKQGPRSPLVIVSPYAKPGYTDTTATTFAGILAYVEHNFGLTPLGPNDAQAYAFQNAFNYHQAPLKPVRMVYRKWPKDAYHVNMAEARQGT